GDGAAGGGGGVGGLWRKPVNGVGWTAPAVPAARKNPRATAVRVLIVAPPAFLCCCETDPWAGTYPALQLRVKREVQPAGGNRRRGSAPPAARAPGRPCSGCRRRPRSPRFPRS